MILEQRKWVAGLAVVAGATFLGTLAPSALADTPNTSSGGMESFDCAIHDAGQLCSTSGIATMAISGVKAPQIVSEVLAFTQEIRLDLVSSSFSSPLLVTAPLGDDRVFVVEQGGKVKVLRDDVVLGTYLDIGFLLPLSPGSEQGLLGMAFHPGFDSNGLIFLSYTDSAGHLVVTRVNVDPGATSVSVLNRTTVIRISQFAANHNGGMILFGPDGMLYLGTGDGGGSGDPQGNGQDQDTLLGAILRLDVGSDDFPGDNLRNYAIPSGNPFVGTAGADEIWVFGLRNPWRFWIDHVIGRLYIADVGQSAREEVTILEPGQQGANLGWNILEGTRCYPSGTACSSAGTILPQVEYAQAGGASITGGIVYRGNRIPSLFGSYFYGDFIQGWVKSFTFDGQIENHVAMDGFQTSLLSSFGVDGRGEMYLVSLAGSVWRVVGPPLDNEMFFYRDDGTWKYYDVKPNGVLGNLLSGGTGYSTGWSSITAINLG